MPKQPIKPMSVYMGLISALTVVFIALKLLNKIHWSWIWIASPVWLGFAVFLLVMVVCILFVFIIDPNNKFNKHD